MVEILGPFHWFKSANPHWLANSLPSFSIAGRLSRIARRMSGSACLHSPSRKTSKRRSTISEDDQTESIAASSSVFWAWSLRQATAETSKACGNPDADSPRVSNPCTFFASLSLSQQRFQASDCKRVEKSPALAIKTAIAGIACSEFCLSKTLSNGSKSASASLGSPEMVSSNFNTGSGRLPAASSNPILWAKGSSLHCGARIQPSTRSEMLHRFKASMRRISV